MQCMSSWRSDHGPLPEKGLLIALGAAFAAIVVLLPFANQLDNRTDRQRPMYAEVTEMAVAQYELMRKTGAPEQVTVGPGETVLVGNVEFTAAPGVAVQVREAEIGYDVRGRNQYGDATGWQHYDGKTDPGAEIDLSLTD